MRALPILLGLPDRFPQPDAVLLVRQLLLSVLHEERQPLNEHLEEYKHLEKCDHQLEKPAKERELAVYLHHLFFIRMSIVVHFWLHINRKIVIIKTEKTGVRMTRNLKITVVYAGGFSAPNGCEVLLRHAFDQPIWLNLPE